MKKIIPLFLTAIFLFNTMGYFIVFKWAQLSVKHAMETLINSGDDKDYTLLKVNKQDLDKLEWTVSGKEVSYEGRLYDVVSISDSGEVISIYCINDTDEEDLFSDLDRQINKQLNTSAPEKKDSSSKEGAAVKLYFQLEAKYMFVDNGSRLMRYSGLITYSSAYIEISSPPPEFS